MIRLSELVSALTPAHYAELSLVLFLAVFAAVVWRHGTTAAVFNTTAAAKRQTGSALNE